MRGVGDAGELRGQQPALHLFRDAQAVAQLSPEELCARWIDAAQVVSRALEIVVAFHVATAAPLILEGDAILPTLAAQRVILGVPVAGRVRSVFLVEPDEGLLLCNARARGRGFERLAAAEQQRQVRRHRLYGEWLEQEAVRLGLPVVRSPASWDALVADVVGSLLPRP